jgi:hypothetical protein
VQDKGEATFNAEKSRQTSSGASSKSENKTDASSRVSFTSSTMELKTKLHGYIIDS